VAEGLISGVLGEDEKPEIEAIETAVAVEAFASAIVAKLSGSDPEVAKRTVEYLADQSQLLKLQKKHLEEEHWARLHHLQGQAKEVDLRRFGLRLRVAFQVFIALFVSLLGIGGLVVLHDAISSQAVVIEPFEVPPSLANKGLTPKVIAAALLDELVKMQSSTRSAAEHRELSNAWSGKISVEIPETGLSLGEIAHFLQQRFGHDQRIEGDLVEIDPNQLMLTVRGTRILPARFSGQVGNLHELLAQAGEYVFGQSQPGLYTAYLANNNRSEEAIRFAQSEFVKASVDERPYLLNYWGVALNDVPSKEAPAEALRLYRQALRMKPDYWVARHNAMVALYSMGREEEVVQEGLQMLKLAGGRPGRAPEDEYELWDYMRWDLPALAAEQNADVAATAGGSTSRAAVQKIWLSH